MVFPSSKSRLLTRILDYFQALRPQLMVTATSKATIVATTVAFLISTSFPRLYNPMVIFPAIP